jgi:hypothetical protein
MSEAEHFVALVLGSGEGGNIWLGTGPSRGIAPP